MCESQQLISLLLLWQFSEVCQTRVLGLSSDLLAVNEKPLNCKSPHDWLVMLSIDLATFVVRRAQMGPFGSVTSRYLFIPPLSWLLTIPDKPPYVSIRGIGKNWWVVQLASH